MAQQAGHGLALEEAVGELDRVAIDADVGTQLILLALLLLAQGELVAPHLVLIALVPVDGQGGALHLFGAEPHGVHARHVGTHAGAHYDVDRDALLLQHLEDADVGRPLGAAAAEHQGNFGPLGLGRRHQRQTGQQYQEQGVPSSTKDAHMIFH